MTSAFITLHALAASLVLLLAPVQILRRSKDARHRMIGRTWVIAMYLTCVSGMFIYSLSGGFTIFHGLAIFTFLTTTLGVVNIRAGRVRSHAANMTGSWLGAVAAGSFAAFGGGRAIPRLAIDDPRLLWSLAGGIVLLATAWVIIVLAWTGRRQPSLTPFSTPSGLAAPATAENDNGVENSVTPTTDHAVGAHPAR